MSKEDGKELKYLKIEMVLFILLQKCSLMFILRDSPNNTSFFNKTFKSIPAVRDGLILIWEDLMLQAPSNKEFSLHSFSFLSLILFNLNIKDISFRIRHSQPSNESLHI